MLLYRATMLAVCMY